MQKFPSKKQWEMEVKVVSRKLVKPSKPTPADLRSYKISLLDEINPVVNHVRILYFSSNHEIDPKFAWLEESLAQTLSNFYVLAGRYNKEKREIDCHDQGAEFSTAEADGDLPQLMAAEVEPEQLNQLLPVDIAAADEPTNPILAVQINRFRCGGLAIGICGSHRVMDSAAFAFFITAWAKAAAAAAASGGERPIQPHFDAHSEIFPVENLAPIECQEQQTQEKIVVKRLVFDSKAIQKLRDRLSSGWKSERPPSRVVAVSTFLVQAFLRADVLQLGKRRAAVIGQLIDVRGRTVPPVPKHAFGTWISGAFLELTAAEAETLSDDHNYPALAAKVRESTVQGVRDCARLLCDKEFGRKMLVENFLEATEKGDSGDQKLIWVTDLSKFGEYDADFGFGKPDWVSLAAAPLQNHIILMNNRSNDGIEAWVCLQESDMDVFRRDKEMFPVREFVSKNRSLGSFATNPVSISIY